MMNLAHSVAAVQSTDRSACRLWDKCVKKTDICPPDIAEKSYKCPASTPSQH